MTNDDLRISFLLDRPTADALTEAAARNDRSRSAHLRRIIRQGLGLEPPDGWTPGLTTSTMTGVSPTPEPERSPCADGQHVRAEAKSGSGMIGCKNCGMVKIGPNWVAPK